jgi:hypothetical protein
MPLRITFGASEINDYLRIDTEETELIEMFKEAAMDEAEEYLNTDFSLVTQNSDGTTTTQTQEAPPKIKQWVLNRIAELYENRGKEPRAEFKAIQRYRRYPFGG